jgi:hypothetical protein
VDRAPRTIVRYRNRAIETVEVIEELLALAAELKAAGRRRQPAHRDLLGVAREREAQAAVVVRPTAEALLVRPEDVAVERLAHGRAIGDGARSVNTAPGTYQLEADGPAGLRTTEAQLLAGQTLRVQLVPEDRPWPWLWIGLGGAVLVAGTIAAVVVASGGPEPITDPTYGVIQTLRVP